MDPIMQFDFEGAIARLGNVVLKTELSFNARLSRKYGCDLYLKREDTQRTGSCKLRGAYNMMSSQDTAVISKGVVCASTGNHAQGVAWACNDLKVKGTVFMPVSAHKQMLERISYFGADWITIRLAGGTFDECNAEAEAFAAEEGLLFIPPFDHLRIIEGQATIGAEIDSQLPDIDYVFLPVGGGGLAAGVGAYFKNKGTRTRIIGLEPSGAASMSLALQHGRPVSLPQIDQFVESAAVKRVGDKTFDICSEVLDDMLIVPEGELCTAVMELYDQEGIIAEPAGVLSIAALDACVRQIKGKTVVCIISGGNNDLEHMHQIRKRSLLHQGTEHQLKLTKPESAVGMRYLLFIEREASRYKHPI